MRYTLPCTLLLASLLFAATPSTHADEGMWPLYDLGKLPFEQFHQRGLELSASDIYNPDGGGLNEACIQISGGSASFVSADGLIITNHHIAFSALQRASTATENIMRDGFYAPTRADEIPAIGYRVYVPIRAEDVTDRVLAALSDSMTDDERYEALRKIDKQIVDEAEADGDVKCEVAEMFDGIQYTLYSYIELKDIRIVEAPPASIGVYGGDIDNWMWPRHTGDFSFLRAYVGPDGKPAEYSADNVPYHPKVWLKVSSAGVQKGDVAMVIGYPGRTSRYTTSFALDDLINESLPSRIDSYRAALAIMDSAAASDSEIAVRVASTVTFMNNGLKNSEAMVVGFAKGHVLEKKRTDERQMTAFFEQHPDLNEKYGWVLPAFDSLYGIQNRSREHDRVLGRIGYIDYCRMAGRLVRWAEEREKPDLERGRGYRDKDSANVVRRMRYEQINLVPSLDKQLFRRVIEQAIDLPDDQRIPVIDSIFAGVTETERESYIDRWLDSLYANTNMGEYDARAAAFGKTLDQLADLHDPFIDLSLALRGENREQRDRREEHAAAESRLMPALIGAYAAWKGGAMYPDANSTQRFNFGEVRGYSPGDAVWYNYATTLTGVMEKETGEDPFIVPAELKAVYENHDFGPYVDPTLNDVPVNFVTTNDGTGGNSGSPVINGRGELIGLDFDTNYEGVVKDYYYDTPASRAIIVDVRYVLFVIDRVYHLDNLVNELTVTPSH